MQARGINYSHTVRHFKNLHWAVSNPSVHVAAKSFRDPCHGVYYHHDAKVREDATVHHLYLPSVHLCDLHHDLHGVVVVGYFTSHPYVAKT